MRSVTHRPAEMLQRWAKVDQARNAVTELAPRADARRSAGVAALTGRPSTPALGARLDAFLSQMRASYQIDGKSVRVAPAFRSLHGDGLPQMSKSRAAIQERLGDAAFRAIASHVVGATWTRGTPEDVRITTQALLDAGAGRDVLKDKPGLRSEQVVRVVMSKYGIGFDCRGYVFRAFLHARGKGSASAPEKRYFDQGAGYAVFQSESRLRRVSKDLAAARTGDIIHLEPQAGRDHNVIVRSNEVRDVPASGKVTVQGRRVPERFLTDGWPSGARARVRVLTVDSSWGGGGDPLLGGAERRVWLHNDKNDLWGFWDRFGSFQVSAKPYDHEVDAVLRPRSEP
jgi:hypothetical protein